MADGRQKVADKESELKRVRAKKRKTAKKRLTAKKRQPKRGRNKKTAIKR